LPVCTPVNVRLAGLAVKVAGVTPLPDRAMSTVVLDPLTVSDKRPLELPAAVGAKTTPKVVLWLGARESGKPSPV
jgi:hypothetical protein